MKRKTLIFSLVFLLFVVFSGYIACTAIDYQTRLSAEPASESWEKPETEIKEPVYISNMQESGNVYFQDLEVAEINMLVEEGDVLKTAENRVEISLGYGSYLRIDKNTSVTLILVQPESIMFGLSSGSVYVRVKDMGVTVKFINYQNLTLGQGLYHIRTKGDELNIYKSHGIIENEFDKWNNSREKELSKQVEEKYLPKELANYGPVLQQFGTWRYSPLYGSVWVPRVNQNWRPYYYGRWMWYSTWGWTWISHDGPWGWTTFHYGRWHWDLFWGWYWIPTSYWGPAWVNWYGAGNYIGWCPMWYDSWYYDNYYQPYYGHVHKKAWTVIRKDQLQDPNISRAAIEKVKVSQSITKNIKIEDLSKKLESTKLGNQINKTAREKQAQLGTRSIRGIKSRKLLRTTTRRTVSTTRTTRSGTKTRIKSSGTRITTTKTRIKNPPRRTTTKKVKK